MAVVAGASVVCVSAYATRIVQRQQRAPPCIEARRATKAKYKECRQQVRARAQRAPARHESVRSPRPWQVGQGVVEGAPPCRERRRSGVRSEQAGTAPR